MLERYLETTVKQDLLEKMVFISGPRQVGKTTMAEKIGGKYFADSTAYLNWDSKSDRASILGERFPSEKKLLIFDEIHKYRNWKNYLKGIFDKNKRNLHLLVTGSARLDIYRKGGDSLLGRYRHYRLHPLSVSELAGHKPGLKPFSALNFHTPDKKTAQSLEVLLKFGGFPEIFSKQSEKKLRQWHNERGERLIKEDIRDLEAIRDLSALQILVEILPTKVGSLLSINSLREDLNATHKTVSSWMDVLERFYYHFRVYPYQSSRINALKKEAKLYLWDWSEIMDNAARFENLMASHLLKFSDYLFDAEGYKARLHFLRDREQRETDFLITVDNKPWFAIEIKTSAKSVSTPLKYFSEKLSVPFSYQVILEPGIDYTKDGIRVLSADRFLTALV